MERLGRWARIVPILAALAWAGDAAVDTSRAKAHLRDASDEVASWSGTLPADSAWNAAREALATAARLDPRDAAVQEVLGALEASRLDRRDLLEAGLGRLRESLRMRPASPYGWTTLARAEYAAGDTGPEFQAALVNASLLGPNEPQVQDTVADLGLAAWDDAASGTRRAIDLMVEKAVRRDAVQTLRLAERRGRLDLACRHLAGASRPPHPTERQLCHMEATS